MVSPSNASHNSRSEERKQVVKLNQKLFIQIMKVCRETEGAMPRLSHRDIEGTSADEFVEHCKLLDEEGFVEARLAFGGVAHIRLTGRGHEFLDALEQERVRRSRKIGFGSLLR